MVKLLPDPDNPFRNIWEKTTWSESLGHFGINNITPGNYRVEAFDIEADPGDDDPAPGVNITLAEKESKTVKLQLSQTRK
jgi:hypothetical protein